MKTIHWGIIGCGDVTEVKSGPAIQKAAHSELVAVMRRDAAGAEDYARRHGVARWYDDADKLINDPAVDAIYIATPPDSHMHYTLKTARAGKPVYVEKPMARDHTECLQMISACHDAQVPLFTAYYRRSLPRFLKVKEILADNTIGNLLYIRILLVIPPDQADLDRNALPWRVLPEIAGGGRFVDLASHILDILDYFLGPVREVKGLAANRAGLYPAEDTVTASFEFENGVSGSGLFCFTAPRSEDLIEITGEKGSILFSGFKNMPVSLDLGKRREDFHIENPVHIQQPHIQSIVDQINGRGTCPSDGVSAARTTLVIDRILSDWRRQNNIKFT